MRDVRPASVWGWRWRRTDRHIGVRGPLDAQVAMVAGGFALGLVAAWLVDGLHRLRARRASRARHTANNKRPAPAGRFPRAARPRRRQAPPPWQAAGVGPRVLGTEPAPVATPPGRRTPAGGALDKAAHTPYRTRGTALLHPSCAYSLPLAPGGPMLLASPARPWPVSRCLPAGGPSWFRFTRWRHSPWHASTRRSMATRPSP